MGCGPSKQTEDQRQSHIPSPRKGWEEGAKVTDNHRPCGSTHRDYIVNTGAAVARHCQREQKEGRTQEEKREEREGRGQQGRRGKERGGKEKRGEEKSGEEKGKGETEISHTSTLRK